MRLTITTSEAVAASDSKRVPYVSVLRVGATRGVPYLRGKQWGEPRELGEITVAGLLLLVVNAKLSKVRKPDQVNQG